MFLDHSVSKPEFIFRLEHRFGPWSVGLMWSLWEHDNMVVRLRYYKRENNNLLTTSSSSEADPPCQPSKVHTPERTQLIPWVYKYRVACYLVLGNYWSHNSQYASWYSLVSSRYLIVSDVLFLLLVAFLLGCCIIWLLYRFTWFLFRLILCHTPQKETDILSLTIKLETH